MQKVKDGGTSALFSANVSSTPASGYGYYWASPYGGPTAPYLPIFTTLYFSTYLFQSEQCHFHGSDS